MNPINFPESNTTLMPPAGQEDSCNPLHVFSNGQLCVSCWTPTAAELARLNETGMIWLVVHSGETQPPVQLLTDIRFESDQDVQARIDAEQRNRERILALLEQEATCELEAQYGLDIKGYFGKWRKAQVSAPLDSPTYWNDVRMMFLELGGQLLPEGEEDANQPPVVPDHLANGTPEQNAQFVKAFNQGPDNLSAN